jgi:hypothetical protein
MHLAGFNFKLHISTHPRILYKSYRRNSGFLISLTKIFIAQMKILKFHKGHVYNENHSKVRYRFY